MTHEERRLMRSPSSTAIELMNNCYALDEWKEDPKTYCMVHCRVYNDFDEYMEDVVCEFMKLNDEKGNNKCHNLRKKCTLLEQEKTMNGTRQFIPLNGFSA